MWEAALGTEEAAEVDDVGLKGVGGGGGGDEVLSFPPLHPRMWVIKWTGHCLCPSLIAVFFQRGKKVSGSVSFSGVPRGTFVGRPRPVFTPDGCLFFSSRVQLIFPSAPLRCEILLFVRRPPAGCRVYFAHGAGFIHLHKISQRFHRIRMLPAADRPSLTLRNPRALAHSGCRRGKGL